GRSVSELPPLPVKSLKPPSHLMTPRFGNMPAASIPHGASSDSITFAPGMEGLDAGATATLDRTVSALQDDAKSIVTLIAYAAMPKSNDREEGRRSSVARALAVRSYLMSRGVSNNRIDIRALGPAGDGLGDDRVDIKIGP